MAAQNATSNGQAWFCTNGLPSDLVVDVDYMTFHLHKLPLISKSKKLSDLVTEQEDEEADADSCRVSLSEFPGGSETFEVAAKFCYGVKIELSAANAATLRCAGEVLQMTEDYSKENLISMADRFLARSVFRNIRDSIAALKSCENLTPMAEDLGIVQRCIDSISGKAVAMESSLFGWRVSESAYRSPSVAGGRDSMSRKSVSTPSRSKTGRLHRWLEDLSTLRSDLFIRVVDAMKAREASSEVIETCLLLYARKSFPGLNRTTRKSANYSAIASEADQRALIELIAAKLPTSSSSARRTRYFFGLLRTANILKASENCRSALERKIGAQLDHASLDDLLMPSYSYLNDTLYDVDCVERILAYFLASYDMDFNGGAVRSPDLMLVGKLMDAFLSEVASDANLRPEQFRSLGLALPDQARLFDDGLYRAVDLYLKAHPWITGSESERICEVMDFRKLTMEACSHAARNERLPIRALVEVLFFEQLQLRNAIAIGTANSRKDDPPTEPLPRLSLHRHNVKEDQRPESNNRRTTTQDGQALRMRMHSVRTRVHELERECSTMKRVIERFDKRKGSFASRFGCKFKTQVCDSHESTVMETGRRARYVTNHAHHRN